MLHDNAGATKSSLAAVAMTTLRGWKHMVINFLLTMHWQAEFQQQCPDRGHPEARMIYEHKEPPYLNWTFLFNASDISPPSDIPGEICFENAMASGFGLPFCDTALFHQLEDSSCFRLQATCCLLSAGLQPPRWNHFRGLQSIGPFADTGSDW